MDAVLRRYLDKRNRRAGSFCAQCGALEERRTPRWLRRRAGYLTTF